MCLPARHAERIREVGAVETMAKVQFDDLTFRGVQPGKRGAHDGARARPRIVSADIPYVICHLGHVIVRRPEEVGGQPTMALVAGHGKQPRPQAAGFAQPRDLGRGDDEGVLHGVGHVGRVGELGPAVGIQPLRVLVEGGRKAGHVTCHDRGHNLAVVHVYTVCSKPLSEQGHQRGPPGPQRLIRRSRATSGVGPGLPGS